jgi:hypothetical protein
MPVNFPRLPVLAVALALSVPLTVSGCGDSYDSFQLALPEFLPARPPVPTTPRPIPEDLDPGEIGVTPPEIVCNPLIC